MTRRNEQPPGTLYLLHFSHRYKHAGHYLGFTTDLQARLAEHDAGQGARLLQVAEAAGITWTLARTWQGDRRRERQLKNQGGASRRCPDCGVKPRTTPTERTEQTTMKQQPPEKDSGHQLVGPRPPEYVIVTWVSEQLRARARRNGASLAEAFQAGKKQDREPTHPELEDREAE